MTIYDDNISGISKKYPQFLQFLDTATTHNVETQPAKSGALTLIYHSGDTPYYIHSRFDPVDESSKILRGKNLEADHIIILGLGLGYHLEQIFATKDPMTRVLLLEPNLEIVRHSLKTVHWYKLLGRKDFFYLIGTDLSNLPEVIYAFLNLANFDTLESIELPSETRLMANYFKKAREAIDLEIKSQLYDFKTRLAESYMVPRNIVNNYPMILKTRPFARLKNAFKDTPCFIISAGPSLDKNILYLEKIKDRAVIVAVDTALKPLLKRGIQPHFVAVGDPSYKNYLHIQGTEKTYNNYLIADAGISQRIFKDFTSQIFTVSLGKPIVRVLEVHSEPLGEIEAWGSVISIALDAAVKMGLNPIIFLGQDFAFTQSRNHCRGTSWEEKNLEYSQELEDRQRFEKNSIGSDKRTLETLDIFGNKTITSERLILYKNFLARLANKYPHTTILNGTEGGIFTEIPHIPLYQALQTYVFPRKQVDFAHLKEFPTLYKKENIKNLKEFFEQTRSYFKNQLEKIAHALELTRRGKIYTPSEAYPLFKELEELQNSIYVDIQYGEILEMWSSAPYYYFLKEYHRLRKKELDQNTITRGLDLYREYFNGIKPLVEDIIKHFRLPDIQDIKESLTHPPDTSQDNPTPDNELPQNDPVSSEFPKDTPTKQEESEYGLNQYGRWLIQLRRGETPTLNDNNPYLFEAVKLRELLYTLPELKEKFLEIFPNPQNPLIMDIGCYYGHTVEEFALNNPGLNVLGLDIKYKRVVKSCNRIKRGKINNARIGLCDILDLIPIIPENSVFGLCIFFPDPWIKSQHQRFRFIIDEFFSLALSRLVPNGFIWLKTDHKEYFEAAEALSHQYGYHILDQLPDGIKPFEYQTIFERIFIKQQLPIYKLILGKNR